MTWFFKLNVIDGPLPLIVWGLTILAIIVLLIRRPTPAWLWRTVIALAVGIGLGVGLVAFVNMTHVFGPALPYACWFWVPAGFAAILFGVVSLWERGWWRKAIAVLLVVLAVLSMTLGINAVFGIDRTVGAMLGVSTEDSIDNLPKPIPSPTTTGPLFQTWKAPADMPKVGKVGLLSGTKAIPSTAGFKPRDATIYLPPAALVKNPPRLPLLVFMMGYPGNPEPTYIGPAMDAIAAKNNGLAPIVIIADQLGDRSHDPLCIDSKKYGGVETYFTHDIPAYAEKNLPVEFDHRTWTIMGYSNGGACALSWGTRHPDLWGNMIAISPDEYPGIEWEKDAIATMFDGDKTAFEENKPAAAIAAHRGAYAGHLAVITVGGNDSGYVPWAKSNVKLAEGAGFETSFFEVPGADHQGSALEGGIPFALNLLFKHIGLSAP